MKIRIRPLSVSCPIYKAPVAHPCTANMKQRVHQRGLKVGQFMVDSNLRPVYSHPTCKARRKLAREVTEQELAQQTTLVAEKGGAS